MNFKFYKIYQIDQFDRALISNFRFYTENASLRACFKKETAEKIVEDEKLRCRIHFLSTDNCKVAYHLNVP